MKQQYKKIPNSWKSIRRYDQPTKTLSPKAIDILAVAMYQVNKYNQAILTHRVLKEVTGRKHDQNRRLIKQLGFVFHFKFSRFFIENNKKYNDAYQLTLKKSALEILENPEKYFAEFEDDILTKQGSKIEQQKECINAANDIKEGSKNAATSQQKCSDVTAKMLPCSHPLLLYIKKLIYIINKKTNVDVDIDLYSQIMLMNWTSVFSKNTPEQIEAFSQLIAKKSPFYFYNKDDSPAAYRDLHEIDTMDKLRTRYLTEFQKIGMAEANREYEENMKRFKC
jgi:hypothetical protein